MKRGVPAIIQVTIPGHTSTMTANVVFRQDKTHEGNPLITKSNVTSTSSGEFSISLTAEQTQMFQANKPVYMDMKVTENNNVIPTEIVTLSVYDTLFPDTQ